MPKSMHMRQLCVYVKKEAISVSTVLYYTFKDKTSTKQGQYVFHVLNFEQRKLILDA